MLSALFLDRLTLGHLGQLIDGASILQVFRMGNLVQWSDHDAVTTVQGTGGINDANRVPFVRAILLLLLLLLLLLMLMLEPDCVRRSLSSAKCINWVICEQRR